MTQARAKKTTQGRVVSFTVESYAQAYRAYEWVQDMVCRGLKAGPVQIRMQRPDDLRSLNQNAKLWAVLNDVSKQVCWYGQYLDSEDWKCIFTAALRKHKVVPGIESGTFVMTGLSTSRMSKREFISLLELIQAFAAERDVIWSDPSAQVLDEYLESRFGKAA